MNRIHQILCELGLSSPDSVSEYFPRTRDAANVRVLKCNQSGVLFLSGTEQGTVDRYLQSEGFQFWQTHENNHKFLKEAKALPLNEDDHRRTEQFKSYLYNKKWVDIGCGLGGTLRLMQKETQEAHGVEPQEGPRKVLSDLGFKMHAKVKDLEDAKYDVATLFHVYEHFDNPIETLKEIRTKIKPGGKVIIEVPQANDALLSLYESEAFKNFTFRSDHIVLHTRESLRRFMERAGLRNIVIQGFQRYSLSNHLHWLAKSKPGGHIAMAFLNNPALERAYSDTLASLDKTDTLIAFGEVPQ